MKWIEDKFLKKFEKELTSMNDKEKKIFRKLKLIMVDGYKKYLMPILLAIGLFYVFTKLQERVGYDQVIFILLVTVVIYLRSIATNLRNLDK